MNNIPRPFSAPLAAFASLLLVSPVAAEAEKPIAASTNTVTGYYRSGTVDSVSELYVLNDQSFCLVVIAGSMDLMAAGVWKKADGRAYFAETKPPYPVFPMVVRTGEVPKGKIRISVLGNALSYAQAPVIGFSSKRSGPFKLRRLFPDEKSSWSDKYTFTDMARESANYVAIGDIKASEFNQEDRAHNYQLEIFRIPDGMNEVRVGYDKNQTRAALNFSAPITPTGLREIEGIGEFERANTPFTPDLEKKVRAECVQPVLNALNVPSSVPADGRLRPTEVLTVEDADFVKEPWFPDRDTEETVEEESVSEAPPAPPLAQTTAVSDLESFRARFGDIANSEDSATKLAGYDALWREAIANKDNNIREVAGRSAVNMTSLLNDEGQYDRAIAISQEAAAILVKSLDPVLRSRAASLLSNQASALNSKGERDRASQVNQKITELFARDTYPSTVYIVANNHLSVIDHLILTGDIKAATRRLDRFEKDFVKSGKLDRRPQDEIGFVCYDDGTESAVECMTSKKPDADFIQRYVAAYRAKLSSMR